MLFIILDGMEQRFLVLSSRNRNAETLGSSLVSGSVSEPKVKHSKSRNRNWNQNSGIQRLGIGTGIESQTFQVSESEPKSKFNVSRIFPWITSPFWSKTALFTPKSPFLSENIWNQNRNAKTLGSILGIVSESSSKPVQSRNRNWNRVQSLCSLGTRLGIVFLPWTVSELESEPSS